MTNTNLRQIEDVWISAKDPAGFVVDGPKADGLPTYQYDRIQACLRECGGRTRVAVDGGAHIGMWTMHLAKAFKEVVAFEPIPDNFECLQRNVAKHCTDPTHVVTLYRGALSNKDGMIGLMQRGGKSYKWNVPLPGDNTPPSMSITCHKLDTLKLQHVDLIKLDVESHEFETLQGAIETIQRCKPVIMIEEKHDPAKRATKYLDSLGMKMVWNRKHDYLYVWG